jgi:hypothetical protein
LAIEDSLSSVEEASLIVPENAQLHARLAELDPSRNTELDRALVLNPRNASWWIMRAVQQEESDDLAGTEASLRSAVAVARYYVPLWSLTAFYYRQANKSAFSSSAKAALSVGTGDPRSIFQMAQKLGFAPNVIEATILPERPEIQKAYLAYSLERQDWTSAAHAALHLISIGRADDTPVVMSACERLFLAGRIDESVQVWNSAIAARWISMTHLVPALGVSLNDETFSQSRIFSGFDWRAWSPADISIAFSPNRYAKLGFSGDEPERCNVLSQYLPLLPETNYRVTTRYRTEDIPVDSGIRWGIFTLPQTDEALALSPNLFGQDVTETSFLFKTPASPMPLELFLTYTRQSGTTRIRGNLWLHSVKLELQSKYR